MLTNILTTKELSEILKVKPKTLYQWTALGQILSIKLNGALRFDLTDIQTCKVLSAMQIAMEEMGIKDFRLARKISEGLEAQKVISALISNKEETEQADASGITKDFVEVPDFAVNDYLETALKLRGDYLNKKKESSLKVETHEQRLVRLKEKIGRQV